MRLCTCVAAALLPHAALAAAKVQPPTGGAATSAPVTGTSGNVALPLAALIGENDPALAPADRKALDDLLESKTFPYPLGKKITVQADAVICRTSNVNIALHACEFTFGKRKVSTRGRRAHEMFATVDETGVPSDGAAGSIFEAMSHVRCIVDPHQVFDKSGGGADCTFKAGPL